jgi:multicomponent Na+:H+ antiporter subunit B
VASGALLYGGVGVASMLLGGEFLDYGLLDSHSPQHGQHLGILLVELGVGITVTFVMVGIFYSFAGRTFAAPGSAGRKGVRKGSRKGRSGR